MSECDGEALIMRSPRLDMGYCAIKIYIENGKQNIMV